MKHVLASLLLLLCMATVSVGDESQSSPLKPFHFSRDVYPLLQRSCIECHGRAKQEGDLRLDSPQTHFDSNLLAPGKPEESELLRRISLPRGHADLMPAVGEPLSQREIAIIRNWIAQGAEWPTGLERQKHWAYVAPLRPDLPDVSNIDWIKTPIDSFVLQRMDEVGLVPSAPANFEKLVRRVFLDLIGLPPTPAEVDAFVADPSTPRFEKLIDDLLQRPQFGERWDHHGGIENRLPQKCLETDQPIAALILDLKRRGLLDETLINWGSEFGRMPLRQGGNAQSTGLSGRDHHKDAFTMWLAGGGVRTGASHGRSDDFGMDIVEDAVHVHDLNATILHLLGLDHQRLTYRYQGREFRLTDVHGNVLNAILS